LQQDGGFLRELNKTNHHDTTEILLKGIKYHNPNPEYPVITTSIFFVTHTPIGGTLLLVDCYFSELALKKPTQHVGLVGTHLDQNIICSFHNLAENLLIWH
jgi:hypothetical protein